ncbi:MAG: hypothetical protein AAGA56_24015 [Myxococcota bacterium]
MYIHLALLIALGVGVVLLTGVVVRGIELYAASGAMSAKAKGQFLGYATSLPELVGTVGTAGKGLLGAGLWNIGASNTINLVLFTVAAVVYGRARYVVRSKFAGELGFSIVAFVIPFFISRSVVLAQSPWTALGLFLFFVLYIVADRRLNPQPPLSVASRTQEGDDKTKARGVGLACIGVGGIVLAGNYLGAEAKLVVEGIGVPEWGVGWILGFITSLPEMTAFFAVFASARKSGLDESDDTDCQENLDSLAASNMSNLGLIYPIGIGAFLLLSR